MIFTKKPKPKPPEQPPIKRSGSASWTDRLNDSVNQEGKETVLDERYAKKNNMVQYEVIDFYEDGF